MLKQLQRYLTILLIIFGLLYLGYELFLYERAQALLPPGATVAGVDVGGMAAPEATQAVRGAYLAPVNVYHQEDRVEVKPADVGFQIDAEGMVETAVAQRDQKEYWRGFFAFLFNYSFDPITVELAATHDRDQLRRQLEMIASFLDQPARPPQLLTGASTFQYGQDGYVTNVEESLPAVEAALYRVEERRADLVVEKQEAPPLDMSLLEENIQKQLEAFSGVGSVFIKDLESGQELSINGGVAVSGLSVVKIAIMLETLRAIDGLLNSEHQKLFVETAVYSGNYSANLLLDIVAGQDNAYLGVDILTESMERLGLENTFIVTPYEEPNRPGVSTSVTPANSRQDITTNPDPTMQTTAEDMGTLLSMIYYCSQGGGALLAVYPDQITPAECQYLIDLMKQNDEGNLIRFGVPEEAPVSHKHGWAGNTHGDAGIVFSPGGDYVIVTYLAQPESDWLVHDVSFPILREISRATYNYFNFEEPNLVDAITRAEQAAAELEATQAREADATAQVTGTLTTTISLTTTTALTATEAITPTATP